VCAQQWTKIEKKTEKFIKNLKELAISDYYQGRFKIEKTGSEQNTDLKTLSKRGVFLDRDTEQGY